MSRVVADAAGRRYNPATRGRRTAQRKGAPRQPTMRPTPTAGTRSDLDLGALTRSLLRADPEIRDIVLFGSMAYAPELAHDVDVLITTRRKKDIEVYWDATADFPRDVDVLVREPGERVSDSIAASVCAWRAVLHGNGETFREASETMAVPTFATRDQRRNRRPRLPDGVWHPVRCSAERSPSVSQHRQLPLG